jgi:hypothetical protein
MHVDACIMQLFLNFCEKRRVAVGVGVDHALAALLDAYGELPADAEISPVVRRWLLARGGS